MTKLSWDIIGDRHYEAGVDRGVFYPSVGPGVSWSGLTAVRESVANDGSLVSYMDGQKIVNQLQLGDFSATVTALTYPDEMMPYDGYSELLSSQKRKSFHLSYRSLIGNGAQDLSYGYRLHLIYNCLLKPTQRANQSVNENSEAQEFSWDLSTLPLATPYDRPTSHFFIDSPNVEQAALTAVETMLYGSDGIDPAMPSVSQLLAIFEANAIFTVTNHGNGTATVTGPAGWVDQDGSDPTKWTLTSPSIAQLDTHTYLARSY